MDEERWRTLLFLWRVERYVLRGAHAPGSRRLRPLLRPIWSDRQTGSDDYPNCAEAAFLFLVALCRTFAAAALARNSCSSDWSGRGDPRFAPSSIFRR